MLILAGFVALGSFTASESAAKPSTGMAQKQSTQQVIAAADRDFRAMDANRDGTATRAELNEFIGRQNPGIDAESLQKLAEMVLLRFDLDRNGVINRAEVLKVSLAQQPAR